MNQSVLARCGAVLRVVRRFVPADRDASRHQPLPPLPRRYLRHPRPQPEPHKRNLLRARFDGTLLRRRRCSVFGLRRYEGRKIRRRKDRKEGRKEGWMEGRIAIHTAYSFFPTVCFTLSLHCSFLSSIVTIPIINRVLYHRCCLDRMIDGTNDRWIE